MEIHKKEITINLDDFLYEEEPQERIDWNCLDYSFDYRQQIINKFPSGWQSILGFDEIIDKMAENIEKTTPLEEMEKLIKEAEELKEMEQQLEFEECKN